MSPRLASRRRVLKAGAAALAALTGCLSGDPASNRSTSSPAVTQRDETTVSQTSEAVRREITESAATRSTPSSPSDAGGTTTAGPRIASISVADYFLYALSSTHPHVHRRRNTQYVLVRVATSRAADAIRNGTTLSLDGDSAPLADRRPVRWTHDTVDLAFAVSKTETYDSGRILFDGAERRRLSDSAIRRLNHPPVFEVSGITLAPSEIAAGERTTATVTGTLTNSGDGRGTFGASISGNYSSGSGEVTATLDAGERRDVSGSTAIVGRGDEATVRLDWGSDEWSATVPVVGGTTDDSSSSTARSQ